MDERLELTAAQKELAKKFNELCEEMRKNGIGFVNQSGEVYLINTEHVDKWIWPEEMELDTEEVQDEQLADFEEMAHSEMSFFYVAGCCDDNMGIRFK